MEQQNEPHKNRADNEVEISLVERLPLEVWTIILTFLSLKELFTLGRTSKSMRSLALTELRAHKVGLFSFVMRKKTMSQVLTFLADNCLRLASLDLSAWEELNDKFVLDHLPKFSCLQRLVMPGYNLSHLIVDGLPPTLTELNLGSTARFNDVGMKRLTFRCPNLKKLNLKETAVTNRALIYLPETLEELDLSDCKLSGKHSCSFPPKLKVLKLRGMVDLNVLVLKSLPSSLQYLDLSYTTLPSTSEWERLTNLETLVLDNVSLSSPSTESIREEYPLWHLPESVKSLSLNSCRASYYYNYSYGWSHFKYLPSSLEYLSLLRTMHDAVVQELPRRFPNLKAFISTIYVPPKALHFLNKYIPRCFVSLQYWNADADRDVDYEEDMSPIRRSEQPEWIGFKQRSKAVEQQRTLACQAELVVVSAISEEEEKAADVQAEKEEQQLLEQEEEEDEEGLLSMYY